MNLAEYARFDGVGLADLVRRREVTAQELGRLALDAIERLNPRLNAVLETFPDRVDKLGGGGSGEGPFAGVPFLVKDLLLFEEGMACECGSQLMQGFRPDHDSELTRRFRRAGFVTVGRSAVPEMGYSSATSSRLHGVTRNPWNPERIAGGSSGGAAAALAAGLVPIAHGSDGGGSIRSPASFNGLVGLKPTRGRISEGPDAADQLSGLGVNFVLTRTVRDCAAALDAVHGAAPGDPYAIAPPSRPFSKEVGAPPGRLRIAVATETFSGVPIDPEVKAATARTARLLETAGYIVEETMPRFDWIPFVSAVNDLWTAHLARGCDLFGEMLGRRPGPDNLQRVTWACYRHGRSRSAQDLLAALELFNTVSRRIGAFFERYDLFVTPTCTRTAPPHAEFDMDRADMDARQWCQHCFSLEVFLVPFNVAGLPAISLPLEQGAGGAQIGMQFVGRYGDEATLFRIAADLERASPWSSRRPSIHVAQTSPICQ
ncbi:MAG: amidase [Pseudomonadota bacterium]